MQHEAHPPSKSGAGPGYELRDAQLRPLVEFAVALAVLIVVTIFAMKWLFWHFDDDLKAEDPRAHPLAVQEVPPGPQLQPNPSIELREYKVLQAAEVESYGWIDRDAGVVRIPVERAIELLAQRGLPYRKAPSGTPEKQ